MKDEDFWKMIEASRSKRGKDKRAKLLIDQLAARPLADIEDFQIIFDRVRSPAVTYRLWSAADVIIDGCSTDSFWYFIPWLIGLGRPVLANAVVDPDSLADVKEVRALVRNAGEWSDEQWPEWESLNYVAREAYDRATGRDDEGLVAALDARGHESPEDPDPPDDRDAEHVWPRLTALFRS